MADVRDLKTGDRVRHRSYGPVMVVIGRGWWGGVRCEWFDGGKVRRGSFPAVMLTTNLQDVDAVHAWDVDSD